MSRSMDFQLLANDPPGSKAGLFCRCEIWVPRVIQTLAIDIDIYWRFTCFPSLVPYTALPIEQFEVQCSARVEMFQTKCKCGNSDKITRNHHPIIDHQFKTMGKCLDAFGKARSHQLKLQDKSYSTPCAKRMVAVPFCSESYSGIDHIARTTKKYSRSLFGRSMITTGPLLFRAAKKSDNRCTVWWQVPSTWHMA